MADKNKFELTHHDARLLEDMGISVPSRMGEDFHCSVCGVDLRRDLDFYILPDGGFACSEDCVRNVSHRMPPHERRILNGKEIWTRTCPTCGNETLVLIHDLKTGKRFCHECANSSETS